MESATAFTILPSPFMVGGGRRFSKFLWGYSTEPSFYIWGNWGPETWNDFLMWCIELYCREKWIKFISKCMLCLGWEFVILIICICMFGDLMYIKIVKTEALYQYENNPFEDIWRYREIRRRKVQNIQVLTTKVVGWATGWTRAWSSGAEYRFHNHTDIMVMTL